MYDTRKRGPRTHFPYNTDSHSLYRIQLSSVGSCVGDCPCQMGSCILGPCVHGSGIYAYKVNLRVLWHRLSEDNDWS